MQQVLISIPLTARAGEETLEVMLYLPDGPSDILAVPFPLVGEAQGYHQTGWTCQSDEDSSKRTVVQSDISTSIPFLAGVTTTKNEYTQQKQESLVCP